jgi:hypothetical protein
MNILRLNKPHTHDGRKYEAFDLIEVDDSAAAWLLDNGIAERIGPADASAPAEKTKKEAK